MQHFATIDDLDVTGRRILVRADLNVPMRDGNITDSTRIERAADTVRDLVAAGARVILLSHFRRPSGERNPEMSLSPVASAMSETLGGHPVGFVDDCIGPVAQRAVAAMQDGDVLLLENVRFYPGEEANDPEFAQALAALGDFYVNDAFSTAHRAHASTEALAGLLPSAAGRCMAAELAALAKALDAPERPVGAVVGGAKVSTKIELLTSMIQKVDMLVIGGGMANTFLVANGHNVGKSLCEPKMADMAREVYRRAENAGCEIVLPDQFVVAKEFKEGAEARTVEPDDVPDDCMILDIGPRAASEIVAKLATCKTIVWNGPMGAFEVPPFDAGTNQVAQAIGKLCQQGDLLAVAGGGDTVSALVHAGAADQFSYLSTAGGAFLEWLEGKELPGVAALEKSAAPEIRNQVAQA